ncbi:MAG TPA: response regulator [Gemmatimonadaceae bacterium]|jgi:CheY-like chemotaxis protein
MTKTLLVIDDDDDIREIAQLALQLGASWTVLTAASGPAGVEAATAAPPDAILLDVMMPGVDGPATFELLRRGERTRAIPVVFLTAKSRPAERERLLALGVSGVLAKPFDPMTLSDQVAALLGWSM